MWQRFIRASGPSRWVGIHDRDNEGGTVSNLAWSGPGPPAHLGLPITTGITARAISKKRTINIGNVALNPDYLVTLANTQSDIIVPILDHAGKRVIATIDVESEQRNAFDKDVQQSFFLRSEKSKSRPPLVWLGLERCPAMEGPSEPS